MLVVLDYGATSNFICKQLMEELNLKIDDTLNYTVESVTRTKVSNTGICKKLKLMTQGVEFEQIFFILELKGTRVILGMDWY